MSRPLDAQALAETFLGDSIFSNMVALGSAWQRGLVPLSLEALLQRRSSSTACAWKATSWRFRWAGSQPADPQAIEALLRETPAAAPQPESLDALMRARCRHLTAYQNAAYARRYADAVAAVRACEQALGADRIAAASRAPWRRAC